MMNNINEANQCPEPPYQGPRNLDPQATRCEPKSHFVGCDGIENQHHAPDAAFQGIDSDTFYAKEGLGEAIMCDPMTTGKIINDGESQSPSRSVIYRYSQGFRAIDEAVTKIFSNIVVTDVNGRAFTVPHMWGTQEKAVAAILQSNVRKDNSGVTDRRTIPLISVFTSDFSFPRDRFIYHMAVDYKRGIQRYDSRGNKVGAIGGSPSWTHREQRENDTILGVTRGIPVDLGYTVTIWVAFETDMRQILEQIASKLIPLAYINVQGVTNWESTVRLDSVTSNLDTEPGDINKRVFKFVINVTAESYLPQPIIRRKAVLSTRIEVTDLEKQNEDSEVQCIISRIERAVDEIDI